MKLEIFIMKLFGLKILSFGRRLLARSFRRRLLVFVSFRVKEGWLVFVYFTEARVKSNLGMLHEREVHSRSLFLGSKDVYRFFKVKEARYI